MHHPPSPFKRLRATLLLAWLPLAGLMPAQAACLSFIESPTLPPRNNESAIQFYGPPPTTPAFSNDCSAIAWSSVVPGPGNTVGDPQHWHYGAAAQARPAAAHVRASSSRVGGSGAGAGSSVGAQAKSVLTFTLAPMAGAAPNQLYSLQFDVVADGIYGGSSLVGTLGSASVLLDAASSANPFSIVDKQTYSDSEGTNHAKAAGSTIGASVSVQMTMDYLAGFGAGNNYFGINLDTLVTGEAFSDFSHTAQIAGITLLSEGVELILPEGFFVKDGVNHWSLLGDGSGGGGDGGGGGNPDPGTVPEPGSAALLVAALLAGGWRRRPRLVSAA